MKDFESPPQKKQMVKLLVKSYNYIYPNCQIITKIKLLPNYTHHIILLHPSFFNPEKNGICGTLTKYDLLLYLKNYIILLTILPALIWQHSDKLWVRDSEFQGESFLRIMIEVGEGKQRWQTLVFWALF